MVYQSSNAHIMSKSTQATNNNKQSHSHQEENISGNNKRMLSSSKSNACASQQHQQQSHHSRSSHEYVNVKNPNRRNSQSVAQQNNPKPLYRSESVQHRAMPPPSSAAVKCRNDHKNENHHHQQQYDSSHHHDGINHRHNGKPTATDIYADDAAEVTKKNKKRI